MGWRSQAYVGGFAGVLACVGFFTLALPGVDAHGDTASVELAGILVTLSVVIAVTGLGLVRGAGWSRYLALVVAIGGLAAGVYGAISVFLIIGWSLYTPENFIWAPVLLGGGMLAIVLLRAWRSRDLDHGARSPRPFLVSVPAGFLLAAVWTWAMLYLVLWPPCCPL